MLSLGNFHQEVIKCISIEFNNWNDDKKEHIKGSFLQEQQQEEKPEMCIVGTFKCVIRKSDKEEKEGAQQVFPASLMSIATRDDKDDYENCNMNSIKLRLGI